MVTKKPLIVVYIPSYNESNTLSEILGKIHEKYSGVKDYVLKVIVVNDGSTDDTVEIAKKYHGEGIVEGIVEHPVNMGLGAATRSGLREAHDMGADVAVKIDADFQHDPEDIDKVVRPILENKTDVCFGSRFLGKINYRMPAYRRLGNWFFSKVTEFFTGLKVTDGQTGLIATNRRYLECFRLVHDHNETQQMIIDAWRNQLRFMEVPVVFHERRHGDSFISPKYPFIVLPNIVRLFILSSPLKIFLPIGFSLIAFSLFLLILWLSSLKGWIDSNFLFGDVTVAVFLLGGLQISLFGFIADAVSKKR